MNLNRQMIKEQAKALIKNKTFSIFLVIFVITLLTGIGTSFSSVSNSVNSTSDYSSQSVSGGVVAVLAVLGFVGSVAGILLAPLAVTLKSAMVNFIRRPSEQPYDIGTELTYIFKNTFNQTYGKKLLLAFLRGLIICALSCLFIVPGILYALSTAFAEQLICDYPDLSPSEACKLSRKIVTGNKGELFSMVLSFIGWYCLIPLTLGIITIYVNPYYFTTEALYYENFRLRAQQDGRVTPQDFMPGVHAPAAQPQNVNPYSQTNAQFAQNIGSQNVNPYSQQNPVQPQAPVAPAAPQQPYYQPPAEPTPAQPIYQPPVEQAPAQPTYQPPTEQPPVPPTYEAPQQPEN